MSFVRYRWIAGSNACARCSSMSVLTTYKPTRPHPHCNCVIEFELDICDEDKEETRERKEGSHEAELGVVPKGGSVQISVTDVFRSSEKWTVGSENGGFESEEGEETSNTTSTTFNHSGSTDESETIVGRYDDVKVDKLEHYDCLIDDFWQTRTHYESRLKKIDLVPSSERP